MITKVIFSCLAVIFGWVTILATVMVVTDDAPAALVLFPDAALMAALPPDVAITARTSFSVTLSQGNARALYAAGASLVLPAGLLGCAPLTS